jgi:hypothetical protein
MRTVFSRVREAYAIGAIITRCFGYKRKLQSLSTRPLNDFVLQALG